MQYRNEIIEFHSNMISEGIDISDDESEKKPNDQDEYFDCFELPNEQSLDDSFDLESSKIIYDQSYEEETYAKPDEDYYSHDEEDFYNCEEDNWNSEDNYKEIIDDVTEEILDDKEDIRKWAVVFHITHKALSGLLRILKRNSYPDIPVTAKSFLKTDSAKYNIRKIVEDNGDISEYVYFSVSETLKKCVNVLLHKNHEIHVQFNIDGLPLYNSSTINWWPILCKVSCEPDVYKPVPVAVYGGNGKPHNLEEFTKEFIQEVNELQLNGISIEGQHFSFYIECFVCDTPARCYVKRTKGHSAFYACERCYVKGEKEQGVVFFESIDSKERTDESFRSKNQKEHHNGTSPLVDIEPKVNMIQMFVLDFMHLCIGVMKRLLLYWISGNLSMRLGSRGIKVLSSRLIALRNQIPSEFQRKPRHTNVINFWKATEFRFFLIYCGPFVLKGLLTKRIYRHFLILHVALRILCSRTLAIEHNDIAKMYLRSFVKASKSIYGKTCLVINMHNLIHLADDVKNMQKPLSLITAFPFENLLGKLKRYLRSGNKPLAQLCRRLHEFYSFVNQKPQIPKEIEIMKHSKSNPNHLFSIRYKGLHISTLAPNNIILHANGECYKVEKIFRKEKLSPYSVSIQAKKWLKSKSAFEHLDREGLLQEWEMKSSPSSKLVKFPLTKVSAKMILLTVQTGDEEKKFAISYLH